MRMRIALVLPLALLAASCANLNGQLTMDFSNQLTPIMLTETPITGDIFPMSFEAGHDTNQSTEYFIANGKGASRQIEQQNDINRPLSDQIASVMFKEPRYLVLDSLSVKTSTSDYWFGLFGSSYSYLMGVSLLAPAEGMHQ